MKTVPVVQNVQAVQVVQVVEGKKFGTSLAGGNSWNAKENILELRI
jgi:hypothetical protein